ncbi:hypothetical protein [Mesorhizobium sp. CN2-181]|uniref:hypothetical protein n=1 Tax=Mesorhizobium yinganensis TaxID=3157707 RepID=UPI0032B7D4CA
MTMLLFRRMSAAFALTALASGFAAAPVSLQFAGMTPTVKEAKAFARKGADDPAGHIRQARGRDDAPGDDRGGVRGGGKDDRGADDRGEKSRGGDEKGGKTRGGGDSGKGDRGGHDDGPNHK